MRETEGLTPPSPSQEYHIRRTVKGAGYMLGNVLLLLSTWTRSVCVCVEACIGMSVRM